MNLNEQRREIERQRAGAPKIYTCDKHGERTTLICVPCYDAQAERVERESAPLRYANTATNLRARVVAELALMNGGRA